MIWTFPPEIIGSNVLTFLATADIVRLDTAGLAKSVRRQWLECLRFAPALTLPQKRFDAVYDFSVLAWLFTKGLKLKTILISDNILSVLDLLNEHPTALGEKIKIRVETWSPFLEACRGPLAQSEQLASLVEEIDINPCCFFEEYPQDIPFDPAIFNNLRSLQVFFYEGMDTLMPKLDALMQRNKVEKLFVFFAQSVLPGFWSALSVRGPTLTDLSLNCSLTEADMRAISESCPNLTSISLSGEITDIDVLYLTTGCRKLVNVSFGECYGTGMEEPPEPYITANSVGALFHACPHLERLWFPAAPVDNAGIHLLAGTHCALKTLWGYWAVTKVEVVHRSAPNLASLQDIVFGGVDEDTCDALAAALGCMPQLARAMIRTACTVPAVVIAAMAQTCEKLTSLFIASALQRDCEAPLLTLLERSVHLNTLKLYGEDDEDGSRCISTAAVIAAIARGCPNIQTITLLCADDLTDAVFAALAQACPRLQHLNLGDTSGTSDEGLMALAAHCLRLEDVALPRCRSITHVGIRHISLSCLRLKRLTFALGIITAAEEQSLVKAVKQLRPHFQCIRGLTLDVVFEKPNVGYF